MYGPRQVGKTTLVKKIASQIQNSLYLSCDTLDVRRWLESQSIEQYKNIIGTNKLVVLDEAQRVLNIGLSLKILFENFPEVQFIATGSSSFELANKINEPLTGRKRSFFMYPVSMQELEGNSTRLQLQDKFSTFMRLGLYPGALTTSQTFEDAAQSIKEIAGDSIFKDILEFEKVKSSSVLHDLLELLAHQVGSEVSYSELSNKLKLEKRTVERYIDLLEKSFIIFRLRAFARNQRNEVVKTKKIYFYDLGIRNSIIRNFDMPQQRVDLGGLWENFCILERLKFNGAMQRDPNIYFWRTYNQAEIVYIEDEGGKLSAFEFKYKYTKHSKLPVNFAKNYPNTSFKLITSENFWGLVD